MDRSKYTTIKIDGEILERIKEWRRAQPELPSVGIAVRHLVELGLDAAGYAQPDKGDAPAGSGGSDEVPVKPEAIAAE